MLSAIPFFPPVKFDLGFLEIHGFGIMVALGLYLGTEMAMRKAKRDGLNPDIINRVVTWMIVGIFVGGHLGHAFFYAPEEIEKQGLIYLLKVWDGLSSFGGFIVTSFLCWVFFKKENNLVRKQNSVRKEEGKKLLFPVRATHYGDCVIYGFPMAFGLGRVGCFLAHDHPGIETSFFLGVEGVCRHAFGDTGFICHDLGLYEAIWACSLIGIVAMLDKKPRFPGFYLAMIPMYYAPVRFSLDYLRTADVRYFGLTPAQYGTMLLFSIGLTVFLIFRQKTPVRIQTKESELIPYAEKVQKSEDKSNRS